MSRYISEEIRKQVAERPIIAENIVAFMPVIPSSRSTWSIL